MDGRRCRKLRGRLSIVAQRTLHMVEPTFIEYLFCYMDGIVILAFEGTCRYVSVLRAQTMYNTTPVWYDVLVYRVQTLSNS